MNNVHRCPKCASTFEKVSGCPHMSCIICNYTWCWVCGSDLKSKFHNDTPLEIPCALLNSFAIHEKIPKIFRPLLILLLLILGPPLLLYFGMLFLIVEEFT